MDTPRLGLGIYWGVCDPAQLLATLMMVFIVMVSPGFFFAGVGLFSRWPHVVGS